MMRLEINVSPLTREAFAPFGEVIQTESSEAFTVNDGFATRYHDLAQIDVLEESGRPLVSIFHAKPWPQPVRVRMMERHPLSSQAFVPLGVQPFLVVVAAPGDAPRPRHLHAFVTNGRQGVNYRRGVWHHPLLVLEREAEFVVIDRGADDENCDVARFDDSEPEAVLAMT